jgi:hypothetical protein
VEEAHKCVSSRASSRPLDIHIFDATITIKNFLQLLGSHVIVQVANEQSPCGSFIIFWGNMLLLLQVLLMATVPHVFSQSSVMIRQRRFPRSIIRTISIL